MVVNTVKTEDLLRNLKPTLLPISVEDSYYLPIITVIIENLLNNMLNNYRNYGSLSLDVKTFKTLAIGPIVCSVENWYESINNNTDLPIEITKNSFCMASTMHIIELATAWLIHNEDNVIRTLTPTEGIISNLDQYKVDTVISDVTNTVFKIVKL